MCSWQVSSLNESITNQILHVKPAQLVRFNQRQLLRVYPSNYRVDSSNFNPQPFWNAGCHLGKRLIYSFFFNSFFFLIIIKVSCYSLMMKLLQIWLKSLGSFIYHSFTVHLKHCFIFPVALNYQTEGRMLQLNRAKFAANGNCGYVLRPKCMCKGTFYDSDQRQIFWSICVFSERQFSRTLWLLSGAFNPALEDPLPGHRKTQLVLKIISGQQLPKPKDSMLGDRGEVSPFKLKFKTSCHNPHCV